MYFKKELIVYSSVLVKKVQQFQLIFLIVIYAINEVEYINLSEMLIRTTVNATPFCHKSDMLNCQCLI